MNEFIFQNNSKNYSAATAIVVLLISSMTITGWHFSIEEFKHPIPELVAMNPMSALALMLAALSLLLLIRSDQKKSGLYLVKVFAACTIGIGILKLLPAFTDFNTGIDYWLYKSALHDSQSNDTRNRIAPTPG